MFQYLFDLKLWQDKTITKDLFQLVLEFNKLEVLPINIAEIAKRGSISYDIDSRMLNYKPLSKKDIISIDDLFITECDYKKYIENRNKIPNDDITLYKGKLLTHTEFLEQCKRLLINEFNGMFIQTFDGLKIFNEYKNPKNIYGFDFSYVKPYLKPIISHKMYNKRVDLVKKWHEQEEQSFYSETK